MVRLLPEGGREGGDFFEFMPMAPMPMSLHSLEGVRTLMRGWNPKARFEPRTEKESLLNL